MMCWIVGQGGEHEDIDTAAVGAGTERLHSMRNPRTKQVCMWGLV
jgi:hypothetical protein